MMVTCPTCHWSYCDDVGGDVRAHRTRHARFLGAAADGLVVRSHGDTEVAKLEGWDQLHAASTDAARLVAMESICRAHFEQSIASFVADGTWSKHPDYTTYAGGFDAEHAFGEHAGVFRRAHPRQPIPGLPPGMTAWTPRRPRRAKASSGPGARRGQSGALPGPRHTL